MFIAISGAITVLLPEYLRVYGIDVPISGATLMSASVVFVLVIFALGTWPVVKIWSWVRGRKTGSGYTYDNPTIGASCKNLP